MTDKIQTTRLLDLQQFLLAFCDIERMIYLPDGAKQDRRETDTEHSYHLAMTAWYVAQKYPELDSNKVLRYALVHDLVEIHAGDVMAIGRTDEEQAAKDVREAAALEQLKQDWPDFNEMTEAIEAYEKQVDLEAVFVKSFDKIMPMMLNMLSKGKTWKKYNLKRSEIIANKDKTTAKSPEVQEIWSIFKQEILSHDEWFNSNRAD